MTSATGELLCACAIVVPIDDSSLYCTLESSLEFKGFLRVTVSDQTSLATQESSIFTTQTRRGVEIEPTLPFFVKCLSDSRALKGSPLSIVKNQCNSCCNEWCLSAHPKYLTKKYQVNARHVHQLTLPKLMFVFVHPSHHQLDSSLKSWMHAKRYFVLASRSSYH